LKVSGATDLGCKRKNNEDYYFLDEKRKLFIVADGMGGHKAGEKSSQMAVETAEKFLSQEKIKEIIHDENQIKEAITEAIEMANKAVFDEARINRKFRGMGCTIIVALARGNLFHIGYVGDTRAYMVNKEDIKLLTEDHTIVQDLINRGNITYEESRTHPLKHMLSRSIGNKPAVEVGYKRAVLKSGNYLLLCSDGLNSMIEDEIIKDIVRTGEEIEKINVALIDKAKEAGGKDNITVIIVFIEEEDIIETEEFNKSIFPEEDDYKTTRLIQPSGKPWWKFWKFWE